MKCQLAGAKRKVWVLVSPTYHFQVIIRTSRTFSSMILMNGSRHCNYLVLCGLSGHLRVCISISQNQHLIEHIKATPKSIPLFGTPLVLSDNEMTFQTWNRAVHENVTSRKECLMKTSVLLHLWRKLPNTLEKTPARFCLSCSQRELSLGHFPLTAFYLLHPRLAKEAYIRAITHSCLALFSCL